MQQYRFFKTTDSKKDFVLNYIALKRLLPILIVALITLVVSGCEKELKWEHFKGGIHIEMLVESDGNGHKEPNVDGIVNVMARRLRAFDVKNAIIQPKGDRIVVQLANEKNMDRLFRLVTMPAILEFKLVDEKYRNQDIPAMYEKRFFHNRSDYLILRRKALMNNSMLKEVDISFNSIGDNEPSLALEFTRTGAQVFKKITSENVGKRLAILIDGKIYSAPVIQTVIPSGRAQLTGNFEVQEAVELKTMMNIGAYPYPVKIKEKTELTKSAWLGADPSSDMVIIQRDSMPVKLFKMVFSKFLHI